MLPQNVLIFINDDEDMIYGNKGRSMCELRVHRQRSKSSRQPVQSLREAETACSRAAAHSSLLLLIHQGSTKAAMVDWAIIAAPFLLPISFLWDAFCFSRLWINYWLAQPDQQHFAKVFHVQAQVTNGTLESSVKEFWSR